MRYFLLALLFATLNVNAQDSKEGVEVQRSRLLLLPASTVERSAGQQYGQLMRAASEKNLLNTDPRQIERLRRIARELIPHATRFNKNAQAWRWEVNLITSKTVNAFCMPGGKIAFYTGILDALQLTDDEVAAIMGHESDADLVGMELAARAGHDPRAAVVVWQKMARLSQASAQSGGRGQPPQFLSTHPSHESRIREIEANLPKVLPLYRKATP